MDLTDHKNYMKTEKQSDLTDKRSPHTVPPVKSLQTRNINFHLRLKKNDCCRL